MFKVANNKIDISHVRKRSLGFGRNDLGENSCSFIWKESIEDFLAKTESIINDFIMECHIDDKNQEEPDILFLYELNYPFIRDLLKNQPSYFLELVSEYASLLVLNPFFDTPYIGKKDDIKFRFIINQIDKVYFDDDTIVFEGKGWFSNRD
ncbi:hypothetical protein [Psychrobacter sp. van23A]|uniref:hypothetical protein n=1 Tax=Psychrobacter sp. van23A TaxID=3064892 RepID=UPI0027B8BC40|nr:hypothetical protein [Psychrobacter sp. van23A]WLW65195.1 hypothetical protein RAH45_06880 [Psychrobacter sp. van23A]